MPHDPAAVAQAVERAAEELGSDVPRDMRAWRAAEVITAFLRALPNPTTLVADIGRVPDWAYWAEWRPHDLAAAVEAAAREQNHG